jgi:hypothetical protein
MSPANRGGPERRATLIPSCAISALSLFKKKTDALCENCAIILALWLF